MAYKEFIKSLNGDGVEGELVKTLIYSLLTSAIVLGVLYFTKLKTIPEFIPKYGNYLFFIALSYALIIPAIRQVRAYKEFSCMSGMMIGMTLGMISGFLGGLMGAMTAFMLFNDNLKIAAVLVFIIGAIIMLGLNYMLFKESSQLERKRKEDQFLTIALTFILTIITTWLIVFGPRSA